MVIKYNVKTNTNITILILKKFNFPSTLSSKLFIQTFSLISGFLISPFVAICHHCFIFICLIILDFNAVQEYLQGNPLWLQYIKVPLLTLGYETSYDVFVKAEGGGLSGQAQAITLGIARALLKVSEGHRVPLRQQGLLTRDSRAVERKKVGLKKARKAPQYSKR